MPVNSTFYDIYDVKNGKGGDVKLSIGFTELKPGSKPGEYEEVANDDIEAFTTIKINGEIAGPQEEGSFNDLVIGTNEELDQKTLTVVTSLADREPDSNTVKINYTVTGGEEVFHLELLSGVINKGDIVDFTANLRFH